MSINPSILSKDLSIMPSQLYVENLDKVSRFYIDLVGLDVIDKTARTARLGHHGIPIIELISHPELSRASVRDAGLFHNAIVFSSRSKLAATLMRMFQAAQYLYEGSADHLVSEAFYFHDPEGNGLELYFDRPRDVWEWEEGRVKMDTLYLDPLQYIREHAFGKTQTGRKLGHVHLKIGDIRMAKEFYVDTLGFDITADLGSALFVSVGGYHHHIGMNTWFSANAPRRSLALGLGLIEIKLSKFNDIDNLSNRLASVHIAHKEKSGTLEVKDPWNNTLSFSV